MQYKYNYIDIRAMYAKFVIMNTFWHIRETSLRLYAKFHLIEFVDIFSRAGAND